jgi:hypothetical protein
MKAVLALASVFAFVTIAPVLADEKAMDKSSDMGMMDCTDAGMMKMNSQIDAMSAGDSKTMAMKHMDMAKDSMAKKDMKGCGMHMDQAMDAMKK